MRPQDTVILNEFMPRPYQALKKFFSRHKKVHCHQQNGYEILKALLPPKEKRGLIFIDPPYEDPIEFDHIIEAIKKGIKKFSTGVYAIWYPVKDKARVNTFIAKMQRKISVPQLNLMCCPWKSDVAQRLSGSGMLVINPPWKIDEVLFPAIDELNDIFLS
jgi:23S rRNA (adenine2030-N6)-methyltransferase